jgi:hypothetical protein
MSETNLRGLDFYIVDYLRQPDREAEYHEYGAHGCGKDMQRNESLLSRR